jgi:hypothetical protein
MRGTQSPLAAAASRRTHQPPFLPPQPPPDQPPPSLPWRHDRPTECLALLPGDFPSCAVCYAPRPGHVGLDWECHATVVCGTLVAGDVDQCPRCHWDRASCYQCSCGRWVARVDPQCRWCGHMNPNQAAPVPLPGADPRLIQRQDIANDYYLGRRHLPRPVPDAEWFRHGQLTLSVRHQREMRDEEMCGDERMIISAALLKQQYPLGCHVSSFQAPVILHGHRVEPCSEAGYLQFHHMFNPQH